MDDNHVFRIATIVDIILLSFATLLILIYLTLIICIRRLHTTYNILAGNVCLTSIICSLYWNVASVASIFYPTILMSPISSYIFSTYSASMVNCLLVYSSTTVTINRYLTIIYRNTSFFKRRAWPFLSLAVEWIVAIILPIPLGIIPSEEYKNRWVGIYILVIIVILPLILNIIFNLLIFFFVRSSTLRVNTLTKTTLTLTAISNHRNIRDIYLLKHMFFISVVFIIGWTPIYTLPLMNASHNMPGWAYKLLEILPLISTLIIILDLFYYNYDLRRCLMQKF